MKKSII